MIDTCHLLDQGAIGNHFSWFKKQTSTCLAKVLDKALIDHAWRVAFLKDFVENLSRVYSYHDLILVRCHGILDSFCNCLFHFQAAQATHRDLENVVYGAWGHGSPNATRCLNGVHEDATKFNMNVFGSSIHKCKREVETSLRDLYKALEERETDSLHRLEVELHKEYNDILI